MQYATLAVPLFDDSSLASDLEQLEKRARRFTKSALYTGYATASTLALMCIWYWAASNATPQTSFDDLHIPASILDALSTRVVEQAQLPFESAAQSIMAMAEGPVFKVLALVLMITGGATAVVRGAITPAISAIAAAALLSFMPGVMKSMMMVPEQAETQKAHVERLLAAKDWQQALKEVGPLDQAKTVYLTSQVEFLNYLSKTSGKPAREKDGARAVFGQSTAVRELPDEPFEKANWKPEAGRIFAMEYAAFGEPRNSFAKRYAKELSEKRERALAHASSMTSLTTSTALAAAALAAFAFALRRRVDRIRTIAFPDSSPPLPSPTAAAASSRQARIASPDVAPPSDSPESTFDSADLLTRMRLKRAHDERAGAGGGLQDPGEWLEDCQQFLKKR